MTTLRPHYPVVVLCRVLAVSRSGYHAWRRRPPSKRAQENARLEVAIQAAHVRTRQTYGPERLRTELRDDGFSSGVSRIKRLRKKLGCGANKCAGSRPRRSRITSCPWRTTCWLKHLPPRSRMRAGSPTSPMCPLPKGGYIWRGSRISTHARWSAMRWVHASPRTWGCGP